tara:strand:+ start:103 stop:267 length:165 start_codon:yes stop_codon:yes gene_type:complete
MKKNKEQTLNPVGKARIIADSLTTDVRLQNKLLEILTSNLTIEQIDKIYDERIN